MKGAHWGVKVASTRAYRKACWFAFWSARPAGWEIGPVVLDVEYRCPRGSDGAVVYDVQNAMGALKAAADALADARIVATDSHTNVQWGAFDLITRADRMTGKRAGVTLTVRRA